jgi:peptidoglycan/xylan/chitin deacetylase (PgdA/CDA1 family)
MRWVQSTFNVIPLSEGVAGLRDGKLPARALAITFDDGYANNATLAAPVLARLGLHATFFIATGYLDGGRMFNDTVLEAVRAAEGPTLDVQALGLGRYPVGSTIERRDAIAQILAAIKYRPVAERMALSERIAECARATPPADLMMTSEQAAGLARQGFALGGHTVSHPILARVDADEAQREIAVGRLQVEELAGRRVDLFAYPNGTPGRDYTEETVRLVREAGFRGAVSSSPGAARPGSDPYQIPRFTPWDRGRLRFAARMWNNAVRVEPRLLSSGSASVPGTP